MPGFFCIHCGNAVSLDDPTIAKTTCSACGVELEVPEAAKLPIGEPGSGRKLLRRFQTLFLVSFVGLMMLGVAAGFASTVTSGFGEIQAKVMLTAVSLGAYSMTCLCSSVLLDRGNALSAFAWIGIGISAVGATFAVLTNWEFITGWEILLKGRFSMLVLAVAHAHASLLLMIRTQNSVVKGTRNMTLFFIAALATLLLMVTQDLELLTNIWFLIPMLIVLDGMGTVMTPLLHFVLGPKSYR